LNIDHRLSRDEWICLKIDLEVCIDFLNPQESLPLTIQPTLTFNIKGGTAQVQTLSQFFHSPSFSAIHQLIGIFMFDAPAALALFILCTITIKSPFVHPAGLGNLA
jgi:hypothetical protein